MGRNPLRIQPKVFNKPDQCHAQFAALIHSGQVYFLPQEDRVPTNLDMILRRRGLQYGQISFACTTSPFVHLSN